MSDTYERVRAISIEQVMREYFPSVGLKPSGHDLAGDCPFHDEKTASFKLNRKTNRWHCFGACAKGGSNIDLLMDGGLAADPKAAATMLAQKFGFLVRLRLENFLPVGNFFLLEPQKSFYFPYLLLAYPLR